MPNYIAKFVTPPEQWIESVLVRADTPEAARVEAERRAQFWQPPPAIGEVDEVPPGHVLYDVTPG